MVVVGGSATNRTSLAAPPCASHMNAHVAGLTFSMFHPTPKASELDDVQLSPSRVTVYPLFNAGVSRTAMGESHVGGSILPRTQSRLRDSNSGILCT